MPGRGARILRPAPRSAVVPARPADRPERAASILKAVEPWFPAEPATLIDEHEIRSAGWIYHVPEADMPTDWPEAIFLAKRGCPVSFTFETPSANCLHDRTAAHVAAVKAALAFR